MGENERGKKSLARSLEIDQGFSAVIAYGFEGDFSASVTRSHLMG
jgi:hypothetical protein